MPAGLNPMTSSFASDNGADELYLAMEASVGALFDDALNLLLQEFRRALAAKGISTESPIFSRLFVSDLANQKEAIQHSELMTVLSPGAVSVVEQAPCSGADVALLSWFVVPKPGVSTHRQCQKGSGWENRLWLAGKAYQLHILANRSNGKLFDAACQTESVFSQCAESLRENQLTLLQNTVRTWVFVRDIDNQYAGMVEARKRFFITQGLTEKTRYIASTGIEARLREPGELVSLDAISVGNLCPDQIVRMEALKKICPTQDYGVTFERGTRVIYGDRSHLWISGTASIDESGNVLFPGDVVAQTHRTLENIEALLAPHGAHLSGMSQMIVYVRNRNAAESVLGVLRKLVPEGVPLVLVHAAVCRPSWLVEIEGLAIIRGQASFPPFFA